MPIDKSYIFTYFFSGNGSNNGTGAVTGTEPKTGVPLGNCL